MHLVFLFFCILTEILCRFSKIVVHRKRIKTKLQKPEHVLNNTDRTCHRVGGDSLKVGGLTSYSKWGGGGGGD